MSPKYEMIDGSLYIDGKYVDPQQAVVEPLPPQPFDLDCCHAPIKLDPYEQHIRLCLCDVDHKQYAAMAMV